MSDKNLSIVCENKSNELHNNDKKVGRTIGTVATIVGGAILGTSVAGIAGIGLIGTIIGSAVAVGVASLMNGAEDKA